MRVRRPVIWVTDLHGKPAPSLHINVSTHAMGRLLGGGFGEIFLAGGGLPRWEFKDGSGGRGCGCSF